MSELFLEQSEAVLADWDAARVGRYTDMSTLGCVDPDPMRWTNNRPGPPTQPCPGCGRVAIVGGGCPDGPHLRPFLASALVANFSSVTATMRQIVHAAGLTAEGLRRLTRLFESLLIGPRRDQRTWRRLRRMGAPSDVREVNETNQWEDSTGRVWVTNETIAAVWPMFDQPVSTRKPGSRYDYRQRCRNRRKRGRR